MRLVVIITVFISAEVHERSVESVHGVLDALGVTPLSRNDLFNVLVNPFVEKYQSVIDYAGVEVDVKEDGSKGMDTADIQSLVQDVAVRCLEIGCKVSASTWRSLAC